MKRWLLIILVSLALIILVYPSAFFHSASSLPDNNDTRLIAYIIGQVQDNLLHHQPLFYGRFFAPDQNTLAYSDLFLTSAVITLPFRLLTHDPIVIFNLAFIIDSLLTFCTAYLLFSYLFKNHWTSSIMTLLFTLSGFHLHYYPHLQMFSLWPLLLSIYLFLRFQKENHNRLLILFLVTFTAQLMESIFGAYLIFFSALSLFLFAPKKNFKLIFIYLLFFFPLWIALIFPYIKLHFSVSEAARSIREAANFSLGLEQPFTLFHGLTVIGIFLLTLFTKIKSKPWWTLLFFSLIMSFGPVIKLFGKTVKVFGLPIPLPYTLFYYLFPGFTGFRTPSRFIILAALAATIIIGYALVPIFNKIKTKTKLIITLLVLCLLLLEAKLPLKSYPVDITSPSVYEEVKALPANAIILELPIKHWDSPSKEVEPIRALYSLQHLHRRVGGISGFATNNWLDLVEQINAEGINAENLSRLRSIGVTHIVENNKLSPLP